MMIIHIIIAKILGDVLKNDETKSNEKVFEVVCSY
jgi:hypothetical protein